MKVYIFVLKAQNKWGILPAVQFILCVCICLESANFFYHRSKRGLQKPFVSVHNAYFTILKTESVWWISRDQLNDKFIIFLDLTLNSQNSRIDSRDSRIDSWKFQESRCKWLSTYFWVALYNGKNWAFPMFGLECSLTLLKNCSS